MTNAAKASPIVKVAVVVVVVVVVVLIMKTWMGRGGATPTREPYRAFVHQTFETVQPSQFAVTPFPMMINAGITAAPTMAPTIVPTVVPTYSPVPVMSQAYMPLLGMPGVRAVQPSPMNELLLSAPPEATREPVPEPVTMAPVLTEVTSALPSRAPTMVPTFMPTSMAPSVS